MARRALEALARRRLGGVVLLAAGVALVVAVLAGRGSGDGTAGTAPGTSTAAAAVARVQRTVSVPALGLGFSHPTSWTRTVSGRTIHLASPDRSVLITFASPLAGRHPAAVRTALATDLEQRLAPARLVHRGPGVLGNRHVATFELLGRSGGRRVRALGLVDSTPYRTYAVTVVSAAAPSRRALEQAQAILRTVRFFAPAR